MNADIVTFLAGLYTEPVPSGATDDGEPATVGKEATMTVNATAAAPLVDDAGGGLPDDGGEPRSGEYDAWVQRPDASGRPGWELPGLPESARWWATESSWQPPEPVEPVRADPTACPWCGHRSWWRSVHGVVVCAWCHPPAVPSLVAEWLDRFEPAPTAKSTSPEAHRCDCSGRGDTPAQPGPRASQKA